METPESIVISLEWAKKLKETGWPQTYSQGAIEECHFGYYLLDRGQETEHFECSWMWHNWIKHGEAYAAPTAEEILRRLPRAINVSRITPNRGSLQFRWGVKWIQIGNTGVEHLEVGDTLANAAAAMYVYLSEHGLLPERA